MSLILGGKFSYLKGSKNKVKCNICSKEFSYHHSTSSLKYHLTSKHANVGSATSTGDKTSEGAAAQGNPTTTGEQLTLDVSFKPLTQSRINNLTKAMTLWIARDSRPMSIVEDEGFIKLMKTAVLNQHYKPPSRTTISRRLDDLYADMAEDIRTELSSSDWLALTTDYWSSLANESFIGVTSHYITKEWKMKARVLAVKKTAERHTAENVAAHIMEVVTEWAIGSKITTIGTDSARNMIAAAAKLDWSHIPCTAHSLQLSINKGIKAAEIDPVLAKARKLVGHFKHSPISTGELNDEQVRRGLPKESLVCISHSIDE